LKEFEFKKNNFDMIRLLAALQVAVVHGYEHFGFEGGKWFIHFLFIFPGVPIFFVISGFLISASLERSSSMNSYVQNRILRIYPALWGCFLFSIITVCLVFSLNAPLVDFLKWIVAQVTIGQFYNPEFMRGYGVGVLNGSLWTIPVELQFYFFLPLIYIFFNKIKWNMIFIMIFILSLVIINQLYIEIKGVGDDTLIKLFGVTVIPYLYMFMFGVFLQRNLSFVEKYLANKVSIWFSIFLVSVATSYYFGANYSGNNLNPILALLISFLTISMAYSYTENFGNLLRGNDISYGVYIYHMVFVNLLVHLTVFSPEVNLIFMLICTVLTALISWKFIEKPALSLKRCSVNVTENKQST
jgi:peptidoglycan/LPS O-acetylase OafA/YrhL